MRLSTSATRPAVDILEASNQSIRGETFVLKRRDRAILTRAWSAEGRVRDAGDAIRWSSERGPRVHPSRGTFGCKLRASAGPGEDKGLLPVQRKREAYSR